MCGICGEMRFDGAPARTEAVARMTARLKHRGPDGEGSYVSPAGEVALGHRRLSVIDLAGGRQPMSNEDGSIWIAYNGEVYNFKELRRELESRGHVFSTDSDTEAIIHQYEEDGPDCVAKFNGMFAFALWDQGRRRLMLARDRLGVKPLYYHWTAARLVFASELSALTEGLEAEPELDPAALWAYFAIQYAPGPRTLFAGAKKLGPGRTLVVDGAGVRERRYWRPPVGQDPISGRRAEAALLELFDDAVSKRLVSDVPLGAFLSGGLDSTAVVAAMAAGRGPGIETFSVDFEAELSAAAVNETAWSRLAARALKTEHHPLTIRAADAIAALPAVVERLDDLISDPAAIPTYLVSRFARERVTVALSGEGADELFAGYQRYSLGRLARLYRPVPARWRRLLFEAPARRLPHGRRIRKALLALGAESPAARHLYWLLVFPPETIDALIGRSDGWEAALEVFGPLFADQAGAFSLERELRADLVTWLPDDLLTKVDRTSMAVGLECRTPYLDYRLVELALRVPDRDKLEFLNHKAVLKRAMAGRVPAAILRRKKAGFALPLDAWFRRELKPMLSEWTSPERLRAGGALAPDAVGALVDEHLAGRENQGHQLFSILLFQMWREGVRRRRECKEG